jgi:ankyrin repeat protein
MARKIDKAEITEFFSRVEKNDEQGIRLALDSRLELLNVWYCGQTPSVAAARHGSLQVLEVLAERGADLTKRDFRRYTSLHYAAKRGRAAIVEFLLSKGVPVDCLNGKRETPLNLAASRGSFEVIPLLLGAGANVEARDLDLNTPLIRSVETSGVESAQLLIARGADVSATNKWSNTALHLSAVYSPELTRVLLKSVAAITQVNILGETPLHMAALSPYRRGLLSAVGLLLRKGADVDAADINGDTPLHHSTAPWVIDLLRAGASVDRRNLNLETPLQLSMRRKDSYYVLNKANLLLQYGASPDSRDRGGRTALHYAALAPSGVKGLVAVALVEVGARVTDKDLWGDHTFDLIRPRAECKELRRLFDRMAPGWKRRKKRAEDYKGSQRAFNFAQ